MPGPFSFPAADTPLCYDLVVITDTSPEAADAHLDLLRRASAAQRLKACLGFSRSMVALSRAAVRARHPELSDAEALLRWVEESYGSDLAEGVRAKLAERLRESACRCQTTSPPR